jgi:hypothetical protein
MAETTSAYSVIDEQISEAWAELQCARIEYDHCPNADAQRTVDYAELRMNRLLDRRRAAGG